jgi:hypothetical protein
MMPVSIFLSLVLNIFIPNPAHSSVNPASTGNLLISKVLIDSQLFSEYSYNTADLIVEEKTKYQFVEHHYNAKNQLVSSDYYVDNSIVSSNSSIVESGMRRKEWVSPENSTKSYTKTYENNDRGQLVKYTDHNGFSKITYDRYNRICRQTYYHEDAITGYIEYVYDRKGNVSKMSLYGGSEPGKSQLNCTYEYTYDNKINPYRAFKSLMLPGTNTNVNNVTREIYTVQSMTNEKQVKEFNYVYNEKGFPVQVNKTMEYVYQQ